MDKRTAIVVISCFALAAALIIYLIIRMTKDKKDVFSVKGKKVRNTKNRLYFLYRIYTGVPFLNRYFQKYRTRVETLYPAGQIEVNRRTTAMMAKHSMFAILCMVILAILARTDIFYMLVSLFTVYIIFTNSVSRGIDKMEIDLLKQFSDFLTSVRSNYRSAKMVEDAIFMTLDELPYEIGLHANRVYEIVTSTDMEKEAEEYTDAAPNRFLEMFASTCATVAEYGDRELETGESMFLTNLNFIKQETYVEITKRERSNYLYSGTVFWTVFPIFTIKLIAMWSGTVTDLSSFYGGTAGLVVMSLIFISAFVVYELILNMRDGRQDNMKEHPMLERLSKLPILRKYLTKAVEVNYTKALRIDDDLKMVGDHISAQAFLLQRLLLGLALGMTTFALVITAHIGNKNEILHDFSTSFEDSVVPDEEYRDKMRQFSEDYLEDTKQFREMGAADRAELSRRIQAEQGMSDVLADEVAQEVLDRNNRYAHSYFKFWYILLIALAATGGYYIPIAFLKYRMSIMKMSMEDEVAQFQSLALILMNVEGMTIEVFLEWMERFAFCFRQSITECITNLQLDEEAALKRMRDQESYPAFKRFCDNLLAIDEVGMVNAFDEVKTEQEYYKQQRALNNEIMLTRKSNLAGYLAWIPMIITIGGYLLYPFIAYAYKMLTSFRSVLDF